MEGLKYLYFNTEMAILNLGIIVKNKTCSIYSFQIKKAIGRYLISSEEFGIISLKIGRNKQRNNSNQVIK